jgi:uncharacterized membrane protein YcaP (DUF421 family)
MESILRGAATYLFVWLIFRAAGKRSLSEITTFDAVLMLIISETTQASLIDNDNSLTNTVLLILTILGIDVFLSCIKQRYHRVERIMDGAPVVLLDDRGLHETSMAKERVDRHDILNAARHLQGLANLDEIEYVVIETTGDITIVPKRAAGGS